MAIVPLFGHGALRRRLRESVEHGTLPASLLLHGARGVGKQRLALWLGQLLLCDGAGARPCGTCRQCRLSEQLTHPDLHWYFPRPRLESDASNEEVRADLAEAITERRDRNGLYARPEGDHAIFVSTVRALVRSAAMSPAMARRKVFVVGDAERMVAQEGSDQAANAFLKLLEEPPADTTLILTSSEPGGLLPTIRSRVVSVRVGPLGDAEVRSFVADPLASKVLQDEDPDLDVEARVRLAQGAPGRLLGNASRGDALTQAQRLVEASTSRRRADLYRAVFCQPRAKARGSYSDTLDALTVLLHRQVREASTGRAQDDARVAGAARAMDVVEQGKTHAYGNVSPALITASIGLSLRELLG